MLKSGRISKPPQRFHEDPNYFYNKKNTIIQNNPNYFKKDFKTKYPNKIKTHNNSNKLIELSAINRTINNKRDSNKLIELSAINRTINNKRDLYNIYLIIFNIFLAIYFIYLIKFI
jgi:hypothetical protein